MAWRGISDKMMQTGMAQLPKQKVGPPTGWTVMVRDEIEPGGRAPSRFDRWCMSQQSTYEPLCGNHYDKNQSLLTLWDQYTAFSNNGGTDCYQQKIAPSFVSS